MAKRLSGFVDMAMDNKEKKEYVESIATPSAPTYPYGLCISFCQDELDKLGLSDDDLEVGDLIHLHSLAKVTSVSSYDSESGSSKRVELVLAFIQAEDEEEENKEADKVTSRLYKK